MFIRHRRDASGRDPYLMMRLRLLSIGAGLALGGLFLDLSILMWGALAVLIAGFALRFISGRDAGDADGDEGADEVEEDESFEAEGTR
jgi:hypothetical protein